jgi:hypothetical protein
MECDGVSMKATLPLNISKIELKGVGFLAIGVIVVEVLRGKCTCGRRGRPLWRATRPGLRTPAGSARQGGRRSNGPPAAGPAACLRAPPPGGTRPKVKSNN